MDLFSHITVQERVDFTKSLAVMLKSGISLNVALDALSEQATSRGMRSVVGAVRKRVEDGTSLAAAFESQEDVFGPVFIGLIKAGEGSGTLEENLEFLAEWYERSADLRREVNSATLYPKLVLSAAVVLGGVLSVFILPKLIPIFDELNIKLPLVTRILIGIALFVQTYWPIVLIGTVALIVLFIFINRITAVRRVLHRVYIRIPVIGALLRHYQLALITQLFGTLLKSGLTLIGSVDIVRAAATNLAYRDSLETVSQKLIEGSTLSGSLERYPELYPRIFINITKVGEESGTLSDSFTYISTYYTKEVNGETKRLPMIMEPLLLIVIACVVGFIAISVILPIYTLTGSIAT